MDCSGGKVVNNISGNMFGILEQFNDFAATYSVFPGESSDVLQKETRQMGKNVGMIIRIALNLNI